MLYMPPTGNFFCVISEPASDQASERLKFLVQGSVGHSFYYGVASSGYGFQKHRNKCIKHHTT